MKILLLVLVLSIACWGQTALPTISVGSDAPALSQCNILTAGNIYVRSEDPGNGPIQTFRCTQTGAFAYSFGWLPIDHFVGDTLPAKCAVGDMAYKSGVTAGQNLYACTSLNIWTLQGGSGTGAAATFAPVTFSATPTFDASASSTVAAFKITLTGNVTSSTLTPPTTGKTWILLQICQDGTGGRTFVFPTNVSDSATIYPDANSCTLEKFYYDGTNAVRSDAVYVSGAGSGILIPCGTAPGTPPADSVAFYCTSDVPTFKTDAGTLSHPVVPKDCNALSAGDVVKAVDASGVVQCVTPSGGGITANWTTNSGSWQPPWAVGYDNTQAIGAPNRVICFEFTAPFTVVFKHFIFTAGTSTNHIAAGIGDENCDLVQQTSTLTGLSSTAVFTLAADTTLTGGHVYHVVLTADDAGVTYDGIDNSDIPQQMIQIAVPRFFTCANPSGGTSTLTLPPTCGARTSSAARPPIVTFYR